ncbi:PREDICTED: uncharacterized protein LOC108563009 [Nicrophorus vespilloides]|uniref:Uncharacterized protein LOC108563009 n=1 Tax=Nicrophorus vespilloides TaxID=110193 RepID=A0ABM1MR34_NICVS|nr:PREDICTED: uncharacterized protein LOC108563009 [Nicrophorus vespilloides]XP_017777035.1 PREDICTED: uncharacterized protein LOC108563009 [Nicrophorus vespilloides]
MSVIIRLQNLPWSANALDIRNYFHGLSIPEGGVHIVGGELGDAFIAFSTDEDARQAFNRNNGKIKEIQIKLLLSSRTEMQKVIEAARSQSIAAFMGNVQAQPAISTPIMPSIVPAAVPELNANINKKDDKGESRRDRRRSRSRSRDRKDRSYDRKRDGRRRDRSRSKSRDRSNRDRRRRDRSRSRDRSKSRERDRKRGDSRRSHDKTLQPNKKEPRVGVWEAPPQALLGAPSNPATNLLASIVANNLLPNILNGNNNFNRWDGNNQNFPMNEGNNMYNDDQIHENQVLENPNCCVRLEPYFGPFSEIRRFFQGLSIQNKGIKLINDNHGKRTGLAYIRFMYPAGKDEALGRSGDRIRNQTITVLHLDDREFDNAVDRYNPKNDHKNEEGGKSYHAGSLGFTCLTIQNMPHYIYEQDIQDMFSDYPSIAIAIESRHNKKSVYIKFNHPDEAMRALNETETHVFEGKHVKVEPCNDDFFEKVRSDNSTNTPPSTTIIISGLPMKCCENDIMDFFSDIGVMPSNINLLMDDMGFSGEAKCDFYNIEDAVQAFNKNGTMFGNDVISMQYESKDIPNPPQVHQQHPRRGPMVNPMGIINQLAMNVGPRPPFFMQRGGGGFMGGPPRPPPRGPPMMFGGGGPRGPPMRRFPPAQQIQQQPRDNYDEELAPPGCILLMENVPYKAGLDEILEYFEGNFDVPRDNVLRRYNQHGLPTGETKVIFNSPDEVFNAIQILKGKRIRDRMIYLSQL